MSNMTLSQKVKYGAVAGALALSNVAFAAATDPTSAIADAQTTILGIVAAAGAAFIAVALAGVGWSVGAKFIKRIGGKA
ncbi:hypothetical protein HNP33_003433 [Comamonas odontotermitis]|uniref:Phage coat protein n=1 Tax=Comamonas odontotermitis TaxID=379895 RepID=A0ABR6RJH2_9BURK|nr:hypothetical protein [Comamonas odontotermitis]MBB6579321.1 hypothetical protein [Comamonas odontotermitis]